MKDYDNYVCPKCGHMFMEYIGNIQEEYTCDECDETYDSAILINAEDAFIIEDECGYF